MSELGEHIEALRRDPTSAEAARQVRDGARAEGALRAYAEAFAERGRSLAERGHAEDAEASLIEAALVYEEELDDLAAGVELYRTVLDLDPAHRRALIALGLLLHDLGRFDDLAALYRWRLERSSDDGERTTLYLYLAEILADRLGDENRAFEEVMKAARLAPQNIRIITRLERLGDRAGRLSDVVVVIGDLIMHQEDARVRAALSLRLADLYMGPLGDPQRAISYYRSALADDGGNPELVSKVEDVFRERERFDQLAELLESAAGERRVGPQVVRLERELARIYETELNDRRRALNALTRAAKAFPDDRELLDEVMRLGLSIGAMDAVAATFDEVSQSTSNALLKTYLWLKLGHLYAGVLDRPHDAMRCYEAILAEDPHHKEARRRLGNLCERVGDFSRLAQLAEDEVRLSDAPEQQIESLRRLAETKERGLQDHRGAQAAYRRILEIDPQDEEATIAIARLDDLRPGGDQHPTDVMERIDPSRVMPTHAEPSTDFAESEDVHALDDADVLHESTWVPSAVVAAEAPAPESHQTQLYVEAGQSEETKAADALVVHDAALPEPPRSEHEDRLVALQLALGEASRAGETDRELALLEEIVEAHLFAEDAERAFFSQVRLVRLRPGEMAVNRLIEIGRRSGAFGALISTVEEVLPRFDLEARVRISLALADVEVRELKSPERAQERYAALYQESPDEPEIAERWATFLETRGDFEGLKALLEAEAKRAMEPEVARELYRRASQITARELNDPSRAADVLLALLDRWPDDPDVVAEAARSLESAGRWSELVHLYESQLYRTSGAARAALRRRIAEIELGRRGDLEAAERMLRHALSEDPEGRETLDQLLALLEGAERWDSVAEVLSDQLQLEPTGKARAALRRRLAMVAELKLHRPDLALGHLEEAVRADPADLEALTALARMRREAGDWAGVVDALIRASNIVEDSELKAVRLIEAARIRASMLGDSHGAIGLYQAGLTESPRHREGLTELGALLEQTGDFAGAAEVLGRYCEILSGPERAEAHLRLGLLLERELSDDEGAGAQYVNAYAIDPNSVEVVHTLGRFREQHGEFSEALDLAEREAELVDDERRRATLWIRAAELARVRVNDPARACRAYEQVLLADPDDLASEAVLGELYLAARDDDRAYTHLARAARGLRRSDASRAASLYQMAAQAAEHLGMVEQAISAYDAAHDLAPDDVATSVRLSALLDEAGVWEKSFAVAEALLERHGSELAEGDLARALLRMARAKDATGDRPRAVHLAQRSIEIEVTPEALRVLADAQRATGAPAEAANTYRWLAGLLSDQAERRTYLLIAARIWGDELDELGKAVAALGELHIGGAQDLEAAELLASYRERSGEPRGAAQVLAQAARTLEGRARADLLVKAAQLMAGPAGDRAEAKRWLSEALELAPTHRAGFAELTLLSEYEGDHAELARIYERAALALGGEQNSDQDVAPEHKVEEILRCLEHAKRVYWYRLARPIDAMRMARVQRSHRPQHLGYAEDLARLCEDAARVEPVVAPELRREAIDLWVDLLAARPGLYDGLRHISLLGREIGDRWREETFAEILRVLGKEAPPPQAGLDPLSLPKAYGTQSVEVPPDPREASPLEPLFSLLGYVPLAAFAEDLLEPMPKKKERVQLTDLPVPLRALIEDSAKLLGMAPPPVFLREEGSPPIRPGVFDGKPALLLGPVGAQKLAPAVARFYTGRALSLMRARAAALALIPLEVLRDGLEGLVRDRTANELLFSDPKNSKRRGKLLDRELSPSTRLTVHQAVNEWLMRPNRLSLFDERDAVFRTADRAGLMVSGSLMAAVEGLEPFAPKDRRWLVPLTRFAASRQFAAIAPFVR
ncbi:MAG: hypothetical protein U1E65_15910 [Myxococcota bacterium]